MRPELPRFSLQLLVLVLSAFAPVTCHRDDDADDNQSCADRQPDQRMLVLESHPLRRAEQHAQDAKRSSGDTEADNRFGGK